MKFTEEEFYGNTQNTVLDNGDMVPLNQLGRKEQKINVGLTVGLTFLKTIVGIIGFMFYFITVLIGLFPQKAIKVLDFVGAEKASLFCYERIYEKEQTLASLYNVVQKSIETKDHNKTSKYISKLQGKSDYVNFCIKVNTATLKVTTKEYVAFLGDLDGYLVSQNIYAKYEANKKEEAENIALLDLLNLNVYSFGFSSYVECLENDKSKTSEQIDSQILSIVNSNMESISVLDLIKQRREDVDVSLSDGTVNDKILRVYTSLKIEKVLHKIYSVMGEESLKTETAQKIQNLQNEYNNLVK